MDHSAYELARIISRSNGVNSMKEYQIRDIKNRIKRDFRKSIDAEDVTINGEDHLVLITRDKGDEQIKKIKSMPDDDFNLGDIVNWNGINYIVYKRDADRRIQTKGRMYECNMKLRWRNPSGEIIERVGKGEDATKYSEGVQGSNVLRIGEFQIKIIVRLDDETVLIRRGDRFMIDADAFIETLTDNNIIPNVFRVTRRNVVTGTFPTVGYVEITLVEDQFVSGQDDVENMIAKRVVDIITDDIENDGQPVGISNDNNDNSEGNIGGIINSGGADEGSWL